jgi:hypothetical protein
MSLNVLHAAEKLEQETSLVYRGLIDITAQAAINAVLFEAGALALTKENVKARFKSIEDLLLHLAAILEPARNQGKDVALLLTSFRSDLKE